MSTITLTAVPAAASALHARAQYVGEQIARFKSIEPIPIPVIVALADKMDVLRQTALQQPPGAPKDGMCIQLPSGVGKSTSARMFRRSVAARSGLTEDDGPVLIVDLDIEETCSIWSSLLRALGDPYWDIGYPKALQKRAVKKLEQRGVEIIILDEFNHAVDRAQARTIMNSVKLILNAGIAPVVCMGTNDELAELPRNPAFERRMVSAPIIGPLHWSDKSERQNWRGFLHGLDTAIVAHGILPAMSGLSMPQLAEAFIDACDGIIGYAHWVIQDALTEVLQRGGRLIENTDLSASIDRHFLKHQVFDRPNPLAASA